ncbi:MAG: DPP IV N-terminal domain-containing protein, partial [Planctomycetota bacterium]
AFAGPEGSDGWQFVDATGSAERTPEPAPQPQNPQQGPNMASTLYGQLLDMEIPFEGDLLAQHTTNMRQVTYTDDGSVFDPVVSRDGRHLFFSSTQHRPTADVYVQEVGSRVITRLTNDSAQDVMPAISPDGTRIAFASNRAGNWDIWVMPATGGKAIQITTDGGHDLHPSWSPDGQHLVFSRLGTTSGRWELWVADVFNNVRTQFIGYGLFPEWSPIASTGINGWDQILFQRSRERGKRTFAVWTIDFNKQTLQAGNETQIVSNPEAALINPTWSPDAQWITFSAVPNPEKWIGKGNEALPPSAGVWMIGVDGRGELPLTAGDSIDMMPAWSPMGQLFFVSNRNGAENLWSIDIAPALLTASGGNPFANGVRPNRTEVVSRPAPSQPLQPQQGFAQGQPQQGFGQPRVVSNLQSKQGVPPVQQPAPIREVTPFFQNSQQLWPSPSPRPVIADVPTDSDG